MTADFFAGELFLGWKESLRMFALPLWLYSAANRSSPRRMIRLGSLCARRWKDRYPATLHCSISSFWRLFFSIRAIAFLVGYGSIHLKNFFSIFLKMDDKQQYTEKEKKTTEFSGTVLPSWKWRKWPTFSAGTQDPLAAPGVQSKDLARVVIMSDPVAKMIKNCRSIYIYIITYRQLHTYIYIHIYICV